MNLAQKEQKLLDLIREWTKVDTMLAFSGGVDSSLLLALFCQAAKKQNTLVYGVTMQTILQPIDEIEVSKKVAEELGAKHLILQIDEMKDAGISENPVNRCYLCKKHLFTKLCEEGEAHGIHQIFDGTNEDDLHVYRPGRKALKELGIISPLAQIGITKQEVRSLAEKYGISVSKRPSMPCLATRFPYGTHLDKKEMDKVEQGEVFLRELSCYNVRVRAHGDIARIEVDVDDFPKIMEQRSIILEKLKNLGYTYVTLDLSGFQSGSMDKKLL